MKLATRINSFLPVNNNNLEQVFNEFKKLGLNYVDLNFGEHTILNPQEMRVLLEKNNLQLNGIALRFKDNYVNGDLGNSNPEIGKQAIQECKNACDYCREAGGKVITIWMAHDGFDYSFQINYLKVWKELIWAFQTIADYAPDLKISIEYKPYQPRAYAYIDSMGITGMMVKEINRENIGVTLDYCHMLMKHENPAFAADIFGAEKKLYGIHINDGYGVNDDGLMVGTASPFKTLEFLYYLRKHNYDGVFYFDTFPVIEGATDECQANIDMINRMDNLLEEVGLEKIAKIIDKNDAVAAQKLMLSFFKGES